MATSEEWADITEQGENIITGVTAGWLDPVVVAQALRNIVEGTSPQMQSWNTPTWWRTPGKQLVRASRFWPSADLPAPPKEFIPRTKTEVLLLHVPDTFGALWDNVVAPEGYTKYLWEGIEDDTQNLRVVPNKVEYTQPVWLAFDPEHGKGEPPDSFWGRADTNLAASEVLSALIQFPEWPLEWFNGASAPNLSGYQIEYQGNWSTVPYLHRWDSSNRRLELRGLWAHGRRTPWSSPSVREY